MYRDVVVFVNSELLMRVSLPLGYVLAHLNKYSPATLPNTVPKTVLKPSSNFQNLEIRRIQSQSRVSVRINGGFSLAEQA